MAAYSQVARKGSIVTTAGMIASGADGNVVGEGASRRIWKIGNHHHLKASAVEQLLNRVDFQAEVTRQEAISEGRYADLTIDDRRSASWPI